MDLPFRKYAFVIVVSILLVATLACLSSGNGGNDTSASDETSDLEATAAALEATQKALEKEEKEEPTKDAEQETAPSATPEIQGEIESPVVSDDETSDEIDWSKKKSGDLVYVTNFDKGLDGWWWDVVAGGNNWVVDGGNDFLRLEINDKNTQVISMYENVYIPRGQGIIVEAAFDNVGSVRNNNIILMCHINEDGWYEFVMTSSGLWGIYKYQMYEGNWIQLTTGGLPNYNKNITDHVITALCDSNGDLAFGYDYQVLKNSYINDKTYKEGFTGVGVAGLNIPV